METLIPQADAVVRDFIPTILESHGSYELAEKLRNLDPIMNHESLTRACNILRKLDIYYGDDINVSDPNWGRLVQDLAFWSEAAVWAAHRSDAISFRDYIMKAHAVIMDGLDKNRLH